MTEPSLPELEALRDRLYAQLAATGDFRRGSVTENYRKCGKPNCACAALDHPGHGPRFLWTRTQGRRKRIGRQLAVAEVEKVRSEIARHTEFSAFFTQDDVDEKGYPVRDRDPASYIATFEPASVSGDMVKAEGIRRGAGHVRQLTIPGDGAAWIWNIASSKFPGATQIVDLFHAREHLHDLARQLEFMLGDRKDEWLAARLEDLGYGYIGGIVAATREYPLTGIKKDEIGTALGYFENNAHRMRYKWFRSCGLFAGSGVAESGCKAVIGQRLKLSGMRWTVTGADAITTLRCQQASRPEDRIWQPRHNQAVSA